MPNYLSRYSLKNLLNKQDVYLKALAANIGFSLLLLALFLTGYFFLKKSYDADSEFFFQLQRHLARGFLFALLVQFAMVLYARRERISAFFKDFFSQPGSAYKLAFFRIFCFAFLAGIMWNQYSKNAYLAAFPAEARVTLPYLGWYISHVPATPALYKTAAIITMTGCIFTSLGLFTRIALPVVVAGCFYIMGFPLFFGRMVHWHIWIWISVIFLFSPCADVWSLDSMLRKRKPAPESLQHPAYELPIRLLWMHFGIIYFFAGIMKLWDSGFDWALGNNAFNQIYTEWIENYYTIVPAFRIDHYPLLIKTGMLAVILFEILYPFLIFKPATRILTFFGGLALHNIAWYLMNIGFQHLQALYLFWLNPVWFKKKPAATEIFSFRTLLRTRAFRYTFFTGILLWSLNFLCGLLKVHSWPFSAYPSYSTLVPSRPYYLKIEIRKNGTLLLFDDIAQQRKFRKESYRQIEINILNAWRYENAERVMEETLKLWNVYRARFPELKNYDEVCLYFEQKSLLPEERHISYDQIPLAVSYNSSGVLRLITPGKQ